MGIENNQLADIGGTKIFTDTDPAVYGFGKSQRTAALYIHMLNGIANWFGGQETGCNMFRKSIG